jgi:CheY-like chemotaxis protein
MRQTADIPLLSSADRHRLTALVPLTAFARDEDKRRALSAGFKKHLAKPVTADQLVRCIASVLDEAA